MIGLSLSSLGLGLGRRGSAFSPVSLFAAGEQGYWLDPSDFLTMFQDTAGTTPVTAVGQSVRRWLDKSGRGNHFTQSSTSNAPILGRNPIVGTRNLLLRSEEFDNASWGKIRATVTANATTSPDGTVGADKLVEDTSTNTHFVTQSATVVTSTTYTYSVYLKAAERGFAQVRYENSGSTQFFSANVNLSSGAITTSSFGSPTGTAASATNAGNGWWRVNLTVTASNTTFQAVIFSQAVSGTNSYTGDGASGIFIWGAQLEVGSTATAYQRVGSAFDVTQAGVQDCYYLGYDGTDDWLQSGTITPGTDKVQVFAGVRKLSDATQGTVVESSVTVASNNGTFLLAAPDSGATATYGFDSKGTAQVDAVATGASAPVTSVVSGLADIAGDSAIIRVNGAQADADTADQGTGNYLAYPHYIGRRGGSTAPFNGRIYQLICRFGSNLTEAQIQQVETFVNQRTGAY